MTAYSSTSFPISDCCWASSPIRPLDFRPNPSEGGLVARVRWPWFHTVRCEGGGSPTPCRHTSSPTSRLHTRRHGTATSQGSMVGSTRRMGPAGDALSRLLTPDTHACPFAGPLFSRPRCSWTMPEFFFVFWGHMRPQHARISSLRWM